MRVHRLAFPLILVLAAAVASCGFHLRRGAELPPGMQRIHLSVQGGGNLERELARQLEISGATLVDAPAPGVADMTIARASFRTAALTYTGQARVGEYAVRYRVEFMVKGHGGDTLLPMQSVRIARDFTYDARDPVGTETQTEQLHQSMVSDAVQAIMFRLRAAAERARAAPESAAGAGTNH